MKTHVFHLHALTALHIGTGQGTGIVDLPIARERASNLPVVPGSALKGVLRAELHPGHGNGRLQQDHWEALFGPERIREGDDSHAGALALGDARLLCLPVRSLAGTFAWVTCPFVLRRYARDLKDAGLKPPSVPEVRAERAMTGATTKLIEAGTTPPKVFLEDLDLQQAVGADDWGKWLAAKVFPADAEWQGLFRERFVIVADGVFDFLAETATEVRTRVRIDPETRTVARGALWFEENLPAESVLWGVLGTDRSFRRGVELDAAAMLSALDEDREQRLQVGGKATIGRGQVRWLRG